MSSRSGGDDRASSARWRQALVPLALGLMTVILTVQAALGVDGGIVDARGWYSTETAGARVAVNIDHASDSLVTSTLGGYPATFIRQMARFARAERLSLFDTPLVGSDFLRPPVPVILIPAATATVSGHAALDATVTAGTGTGTSAVFVVTGHRLHHATVATGRHTAYGWFAVWDTTTVLNGTYQLTCVVRSRSGARTASLPIAVTVRNKRPVVASG